MKELKQQALDFVAQAKEMPGYTVAWENHSRNVARIAETIAEAVNEQVLKLGGTEEELLDTEIVFSAGLLHDIGRCVEEHAGLRHPILGYDFLKKKNLPILARVAMTHTYYGYHEIEREEFWEELDEVSNKFTQEYMEQVTIDDYDLLVQLADNMGHNLGVMTISDRFCDILVRHNIRFGGAHLRELYKIKQYFDKKTGVNIYELFRDEIIKTTMMEPNTSIGGLKDITDETEEKI